MAKHGLGIIIDDDSDLQVFTETATTFTDKLQVAEKSLDVDGNEQKGSITLKNDVTSKIINVYVIINSGVLEENIWSVLYPGKESIPTVKCLRFTEKSHSFDYLRARLAQWMREDGCETLEVFDHKGEKL